MVDEDSTMGTVVTTQTIDIKRVGFTDGDRVGECDI
jgi:hypothetical protein